MVKETLAVHTQMYIQQINHVNWSQDHQWYLGKYDLILGQSSETSLSGGWFVQWLDVGFVKREMGLESQLPSLST